MPPVCHRLSLGVCRDLKARIGLDSENQHLSCAPVTSLMNQRGHFAALGHGLLIRESKRLYSGGRTVILWMEPWLALGDQSEISAI